MSSSRLSFLFAALFFLTLPAAAQDGSASGDGRPEETTEETTAAATRIGTAASAIEAPLIDGMVDDEVWENATPFTDFIQSNPVEGRPSTERTEVRVLFDDEAVYIGAILYDSDPSGIIATDARRDSSLDDTDSFRVVFDTYHDLQNGFIFGTTPAGLEYDGQLSNAGGGSGFGGGPMMRAQSGSGGGFNLNWDASWTVRTHIGDFGWSAEFAIPLRTLRYGGSPQVWGVNFQRNIRRKREEAYWSPVARIYNINRLSTAGELHGLDLPSPRNFKVIPYALGAGGRDYSVETEFQTNYDIGIDAKVGITQSLNLDLTWNTDFAQVEVDDQQINLTRFNLFFPEKRPFFLENAGNFSMGSPGSVDLFFSRRIGIGPGGAPVPILGGARLSGKAGEYNLGLLNMQTQEVAGVVAANNFTVVSLSRELGERSSFGGMLVNRAATGSLAGEDNWNRTWGVDGQWGIGELFTFTGFAARTETPGYEELDGGEYAYRARGEYFSNRLRLWMGTTEVARNFNPEAGFLRRRSYRSLDWGYFSYHRPEWGPIFRELRPHITFNGFWTLDGFLESSRLHVDNHFDFENGWYFSPAMNLITEGLEVPFEIREGIVVPPGTYRHWQAGWRWNTNRADAFSYSGGVDYGGFLSGDQRTVDTTFNFRWGTRLITSASWLYNDIDLAEGDFVANLGQFRVAYNFTPLIYLQALFQYNDDSDIWSSNVRLNWLNTAGTGLFIVYNDTEGLGNSLIGPQNRSLTVKYTRQFDIYR